MGASFRLRRDRRSRQRRRDSRRPALAGQPHARSRRPVSRHSRAADDGDDGRARGFPIAGTRAARAPPGARYHLRGLRQRPRGADRRVPSADPRDRRGPPAGLRRAAGTRHGALVLRRLGADPLRHRDGQLRHLQRAARPRRGEPRDRRPARHRGGLRARRQRYLRGGSVKLVTFETADGARRAGALDGGEISVFDVPDMRTLFERGLDPAAAAAASGERVALADVRLCAPIVPKKFFHTAGNFREHEEESKVVGWSHEIAPWIMFFQNVDAIIGPDDPVIYPEHLTEELDHELELAVIIGKAGKHFDAQQAASYIAGYTIFNDITARDIQRREMRSGVFSFCKAIDSFCPLGPWIVTPDEVGDPHDLKMCLRVNGEVRQESHSGNMSVTIPEIVAHYSAPI